MRELGPYRIEGELARGGAGVVLRARDRRDGQAVALKVLPGGVQDEHQRRRFAREVQALVRLEHPHIVRVRDAGEDQGHLWLAMELVQGESLSARVEREGPLEPEEVARVGLHLARALAFAHEAGLVHRDVKPANVLLDREGQPRLVDFGLVRDQDPTRTRLSRTGVYLGTPGYWPPEQALGQLERIGPASDVYGLGATLYAALTARPPFVQDTLPAQVDAAERQAPLPPSRLVAGLDPALEAIVLRCLEKEPGDRYPDAETLAAALQGWLRGSPEATAPSRAASGRRAPLLAAGLLLGAAAVAALVLARGRPRPAEERPTPAPPASASPTPDESQAALARAAALLDEGAAAAAAEACARLLARDPRLAPARRLQGLALVELERREEALPELEAALQAGLDDPALRSGLALARLAARDARGAREEAERAVARGPEAWQAHRALGEVLLAAGELDAARAALDRALALSSRAPALALRARARELAGDGAGALEDLDAALRREERTEWLLRRAGLHLDAERLGPAAQDAERALVLLPEAPRALTLLAAVRARQQRPQEALGLADRALAAAPQDAQTRWARALALEGLEREREAEAEADRALELDPGLAPARRLRARLRAERGAVGPALEDLDRALEASPDPRLLIERAGLRAGEADARGAEEDLQRALAAAPDDVQVQAGAAGALLELGRLDLALAHAERAVSLSPDAPDLLTLRASLRGRLRRWAGALEDMNRVVELTPDSVPARQVRACLRRRQGDSRGARQDAETLLRRDPRDPVGRAVRGLSRLAQDDVAGAAEDAQVAAEVDPGLVETQLLLGLLCAEQGKWELARQTYDLALERDPDRVELLLVRGVALRRLGQGAAARADFDRAIELEPEESRAWYRRGRDRLDYGPEGGGPEDPREALADLERACQLDPRDPEALLYRGVARDRLEDAAGALADYSRALELAPDLVDGWLQRAVLRMHQGDHAGMESDASRAVELAPEQIDGWFYRGAARLLRGEDLVGAEADASRALKMLDSGVRTGLERETLVTLRDQARQRLAARRR